MTGNSQLNGSRSATRNMPRTTEWIDSDSRAAHLEARDDRTFILDHEDVGFYVQAMAKITTDEIKEAADDAVDKAVIQLNRSAGAAVAQMTAEFAPITARTKALVNGVATSHEVQAINTAFALAVDKTEKLQNELNETKKELQEEKQKRLALEGKVEEIYQYLKSKNV